MTISNNWRKKGCSSSQNRAAETHLRNLAQVNRDVLCPVCAKTAIHRNLLADGNYEYKHTRLVQGRKGQKITETYYCRVKAVA